MQRSVNQFRRYQRLFRLSYAHENQAVKSTLKREHPKPKITGEGNVIGKINKQN